MIDRWAVLALLMFPGLCWAQGNEATTATEGTESGASVQIGAGSTSAVTTGSSGPRETGDETVPPVPPPYSITPERDTFLGPGMLDIRAPDRLRCDLISDAGARKRCASQTSHEVTGTADD